jgi:hypothetical protein
MRLLRSSALCVAALSLAVPARAFTFLSGSLPQLLTEAESPYVALSTLTVSGQSTFEPGVEVLFTAGTGIVFPGSTSLTVIGTEAKPILLHGYQGAAWDGIQASCCPTALHTFEWVHFADATVAYGSAFWGGSAITFRDCMIDAGAGTYGLSIRNGTGLSYTVTVERVSVVGASNTGLYLDGHTAYGDTVVLSDCSATSCSVGFSLSGSGVTASNLTSENNNWGLFTYLGPSISSSSFSHNGTGVSVSYSEATNFPTFTNVSVVNNTGTGVYVNSDGKVKFDASTIEGNGSHAVRVESNILTYTTQDFRNCNWGAETTAEMVAEGTFSDIEAIFDWWDDSSKSLVDYQGFINPTSAGSSMETASWASVKARYRE